MAELHGMCWGIENSKSYEQLRPWTASSHSVRILLWFMPSVLYNLWVMTRFMAARQCDTAVGRPPCPLHLFVLGMRDELDAAAKSGEPNCKPLD